MTLTKSFLGMCLSRNQTLVDTKLKAEDFPPSEAAIFSTMKQLYLDGSDVNLMTLASAGADLHVIKGLEEQLATNWRAREKQIIEASRKREILALAERVLDSSSLPSSELLFMLEGGVGSLDRRGDYEPKRVFDVAKRVQEEIFMRGQQGAKMLGLPSGMSRLDYITYGFQKRKLYYIGSRPSQGKTSLLVNFAVNCKARFGFFSAESGEDEIAVKMFAHHSKINSRILVLGASEEETSRLSNFVDIEKDRGSLIYDRANMGIDEITGLARTFVENYGVEILFIDYVQILGASQSEQKKDRREQIVDISMRLKQLARDLNVPVVVAAQLVRDADRERPRQGSFAESSQIEKDADVAILIWHTKRKVKKEVNGKEVTVDEDRSYLIVDKNRDGQIGDIPVFFKKGTQTFENLDDWG